MSAIALMAEVCVVSGPGNSLQQGEGYKDFVTRTEAQGPGGLSREAHVAEIEQEVGQIPCEMQA